MSDYRRRLQRLFEKYDPEKLPTVDVVLENFVGQEEKVMAALVKKYGPEPPSPATMSSKKSSKKTAALVSPNATKLKEKPKKVPETSLRKPHMPAARRASAHKSAEEPLSAEATPSKQLLNQSTTSPPMYVTASHVAVPSTSAETPKGDTSGPPPVGVKSTKPAAKKKTETPLKEKSTVTKQIPTSTESEKKTESSKQANIKPSVIAKKTPVRVRGVENAEKKSAENQPTDFEKKSLSESSAVGKQGKRPSITVPETHGDSPLAATGKTAPPSPTTPIPTAIGDYKGTSKPAAEESIIAPAEATATKHSLPPPKTRVDPDTGEEVSAGIALAKAMRPAKHNMSLNDMEIVEVHISEPVLSSNNNVVYERSQDLMFSRSEESPEQRHHTHRLKYEALRRTLIDFYEQVAPERIDTIDYVLFNNEGEELKLFGQLETKYRYGESETPVNKNKRLKKRAVPPVFPAGYLQKEYHKHLTHLAIETMCVERIEEVLRNNKRHETDPLSISQKAFTTKDNKGSSSRADTRVLTTEEIKVKVNVMEKIYKATPGKEKAVLESELAAAVGINIKYLPPSNNVWFEVALDTAKAIAEEDEWDTRLVEYLRKGREIIKDGSVVEENGDSLLKKKNSKNKKKSSNQRDDDTSEESGEKKEDDNESNDSDEDEKWSGEEGKKKNRKKKSKCAKPENSQDIHIKVSPCDAEIWQMIYMHHQKVRRSLFCGEQLVDSHVGIKNTLGDKLEPPVVADLLKTTIAAGYASTCDVTPRQQVHAFCIKYCPGFLPLANQALWRYRGREHELIAKLHKQYGVHDNGFVKAPHVGGNITLTDDTVVVPPLVGSEKYLSEVMHGQVVGLGREVEIATKYRLAQLKKKTTKLSKNMTQLATEMTMLPVAAYPCEDVSFRSWSNIPPALQSIAHMARHFGLGPQVIHQMHAQNPLNPKAVLYELLCMIFPDAIYACMTDEAQKVAFIARRISELMSFIKKCNPSFDREMGKIERLRSEPLPLEKAIPQLLQKYCPLDIESDADYEKRAHEESGKVRFIRKPTKRKLRVAEAKLTYEGSNNNSKIHEDDDVFYDPFAPEQALADAISEHFGDILIDAPQHAFPWRDMYRHINEKRHEFVLECCRKWAVAYGPLPASDVITIDLIKAAQFAVNEQLEKVKKEVEGDAKASDSVTKVSDDTATVYDGDRCFVSAHVPSTLNDPKSNSLKTNVLKNALEAPSILHRLVNQRLTRSTPVVYDGATKPWLRNTCEVGTMTRHQEEVQLFQLLHMHTKSTCTNEDGMEPDDMELGDKKYRDWPVHFRYKEEYNSRLEKMSLPELQRERHKALFGDGANKQSGGRDVIANIDTVCDKLKHPEIYSNKLREIDPAKEEQRYDYKKSLDPNREARRKHRELYFGIEYTSGDEDDVYGNQKSIKPAGLIDDFKETTEEISSWWYDAPSEEYDDEDEYRLAAHTTGDGVVGLVRKYRKLREMLKGAKKQIHDLAQEKEEAKRALENTMFLCNNSTINGNTIESTFSLLPDSSKLGCKECSMLLNRVNALSLRLHEIRYRRPFAQRNDEDFGANNNIYEHMSESAETPPPKENRQLSSLRNITIESIDNDKNDGNITYNEQRVESLDKSKKTPVSTTSQSSSASFTDVPSRRSDERALPPLPNNTDRATSQSLLDML